MTNPAIIQTNTTTVDVTTGDEITMAVLEFSNGTFKLITLATQKLEVNGQIYSGQTSRCEATAPLEQAIANTPAMFAGEADETEWTPETVEQLFGKMGRYFSRFHTVQQQQRAIAEQLGAEEAGG